MTDTVPLETMIPVPVTVTVAGTTITITPMKVKNLSAVLRVLNPILADFPNQDDFQREVFGLVSKHSDGVVELAAILSAQSIAWVEDLDLDELVLLLTAVVRVNVDFFTLRVFPSLSRAMADMMPERKLPPTGQ